MRLTNETKEVLPELEVRARIFETWELLEIFYQGKTVCVVSISGDRFHIENRPDTKLFVSADWDKLNSVPVLCITKDKTVDPNFEINLKREKKLQWRVVSDPLRFVMTDEELAKQRAMSIEDNLLKTDPHPKNDANKSE